MGKLTKALRRLRFTAGEALGIRYRVKRGDGKEMTSDPEKTTAPEGTTISQSCVTL